MKATGILSILFIYAATATWGWGDQKIGYVSTAFILSQLPQTQKANDELSEMQAKFQAQGQVMVDDIKAKYDDFVEKNRTEQLSENMKQLGQQELNQMQQDLESHNRRSTETLNKRRSVLMKPILKMVNETIGSIAKEEGYDMVIDVQESGLLFGSPDYNLTQSVLEALGVEAEETAAPAAAASGN